MIRVPISIGELLDKISILQIKSEKTDNQFIHKELNDLTEIAKSNNLYNKEYLSQLKCVNTTLWDIEDKLRELENEKVFDKRFIELARSVYITNDKRFLLKKKINDFYKSEYREIKLHNKYQ